MNRAALTVGAMILLVGAAAWLALQGGGEPHLPPPTETTASTDAAASATGAAIDGPSDAPNATEATHAAERDAVALRESLLPPPDDAQWIDVRVVDADSKQPVPGATVGWYDQRIVQELEKRPELLPHPYSFTEDFEAVATAFGWLTTADARGVARIQQARGTLAFARHGDRYGTARLDRDLLAPKSGHEIALEADFTLRVQTLSATGEPAIGVPVGIVIWDAKGKPSRLRRWGAEAVSVAPAGIAEFPHAQNLRRAHADSTKRGETWRLAAVLPNVVGESAPVGFDPPPTEPLVVQLPPTGSMRVRSDSPSTADGYRGVWLRAKSDGNNDIERAQMYGNLGPDGWARFPFLPLGRRYYAMAVTHGGWLSQEAIGPAAAGIEVEVVLAPGRNDIQLAGRILDEQRQPLADTAVEVRLLGRRQFGDRNLRTDAEGRFVMLVGTASNEAEDKVDGIVVEVRDEAHGQRVVRLPGRSLRPGVEPLGDLVLGRDPLVVAGRFTVDGVPTKPELHPQIERHAPREDQPERWASTNLNLPTIAADGSFEVRGIAEPGRYRLRLHTDVLQRPEPVEFALGTRDLVVPLRTGGNLAVSVLLPDGGRANLLGRLVPAAMPDPPIGGDRLDATNRGGTGGRQQLIWRGLPHGRYSVELRLPGFAEPLTTIEDVAVPATKPPDPRLVDVDLTTQLRVQRITLVSPDGKTPNPWETALLPLPQDGVERLQSLPPDGLQNGFLLPNRNLELLVAYRGHQSQRVLCTGAPLEVRLVPWPTVTLTLPALPGWPTEWQLQASLEAPSNLDTRNYQSEWNGGPIADLIGPPTRWTKVEDGRVVLPVGDAPQRIRLQARKDRQTVAIGLPQQSVTMATGTHQIQLDVEAVLKALAAAPKKAR